MAQLIKSLMGLAIASVKAEKGLAIAGVKSINGLDNTSSGGGPGVGTISFVAAGAAAIGTTSVAPGYPAGLASGDEILMFVENKYPANGPTTPSGFSLVGQYQGGQGSAGADAGDVYITVYRKTSDGTETGTVSVTIASGNSAVARMMAYRSTSTFAATTVVGGADDIAGTSWSVTASSGIEVSSTDWVVVGSAANGASGGVIASAHALAGTGITYGAGVERSDSGTSGGDNSHLVIADFPVSSGSASDAPVYTFTSSVSGANWPAGASAIVRLRTT